MFESVEAMKKKEKETPPEKGGESATKAGA